MSNAERQKLHRQRLRERASIDNVGLQVKAAVDRAIGALWSSLSRPDAEGRMDGSLDGVSTVDDLRRELADTTTLITWSRDQLRYPDDLTSEEIKALSAVVEIGDEIELTAYRTKPRGRR